MTIGRLIFRPELIVKNEVPSGAVDGINLVYGTLNVFVANSLEVFLDGKRLELNKDFLVNPDNNGFTLFVASSFSRRLNTPPLCGEEISVNYIRKC